MIYLTNGNMPLNEAYNDEIVQEHNNTYQLTFRFPTSDPKWELLKEETFLTADDLHGEQDFYIFEVEKQQGYIQVYANQVFSLLNNYVVNAINLDRETGASALSRFAGSITRDNPFSFFSDIEDRHTFNIDSKNAMEAFAKDKHSILGQWGGDLVRHGYQVRLLKNGGSENESLFMYKKNLSSYQHKTSTKSLRTRITFKTTIKGEGEKVPDKHYSVTIESSLINKYNQIYEDVVEVNDQDVKDEASLRKYGEQYFRTTLCDMLEDSLEIEVVGQSDVPVRMFDVVSIYHEGFGLDVRKKITKYTYSPMAKKLKSIGFGQFKSGLSNAIGNMVSDALKNETEGLLGSVDAQIAKELRSADLAFDRKKEELVNQFTDELNATKAKAEEVKRQIADEIDKKFQSFDNASIQEAKRKAEEALRNAGASSLLAQEAKRISLDSIAKLNEFKRQATSAQTALSGDLDALKRTITNDIRPKQTQVENEISKQVEALVQTKKELAGVKSAQSTFEQSTTRRLSELTNLANGKASKSELTQTAEELTSKIASVQVAHRNQGDRVSAIESNFKQRADALDAGVNRLTEGLRTKADISSLNVTAENIRQSVKSLETNTQNKLNQKLSLAEFEVRAGSIRQEILNATKDKADKTLVISEAGKIREEFSKMKVGGRNYAEDYDFSRSLWQYSQGDSSPQDWTILNGEYNVKGTTKTWKQMQIHSKEGSRASGKSSTALLDLEIGETYTLSFQGICYSGSPNVWLSLRANRTAPGNPEIMYGNFNLTSSWQTYQVTIPALTRPDNFDFWRIILGYNEIGHVAFRKVELTRSSTRIDAGPAPEDGKTDLVVAKSEFEKTAEGLSAKLAAIETYVGQDGQRQEALRRYTREESAKQATAVRELVTRDYVGKATYQEDVRGIERRLEAITNSQNGSIATQIAKYKTAVDGRFADITSMISGKANQTDFQRVRETSQLYERILGNTENGITDKVARIALTNQLFQVEVSKALKGGRNYIRNGQFKNGSKNWLEYQSVDFGLNFNYQHSQNPHNRNHPGLHFYHESQDVANFFGIQQSLAFDGVRGEKVSVSLLVSKDGGDSNSGLKVALHYIKNKNIIGQEWQSIPSPQITSKYKRFTFTFTLSDDVENLNLMLYGEKGKTINLYVTDVQLERGSVATDYKEAPEDTDEAIRSVQSQLDGSWSVQNLTSAGALVSGLNLGANGHNRLDGKLTHITGETLIDKAVIKSAMVDKLKTANFEAGSVTTVVLDAEAVTADKVRMDQAFANKLVASNIFTDMLAAKEAFINKLRSVVVTATFLEGFQGKIGGFRFGQYTNRNGYFITGINSVSIGMGNGTNAGANRNAFWANWGESLDTPGPKAWYVNTDGKMYCRNDVDFYSKVDFASTSKVNFYSKINAPKGIWIASDDVNGEGDNPAGGYNAVVWWSQIVTGKWRQHAGITTGSDRKLKENIEPTPVKALDKINALNLVAFDYIKDKTHEEIGLIAQEALNIIPGAVEKYEGEDNHLTINYSKFVPYLIKAIQELNSKLEKTA